MFAAKARRRAREAASVLTTKAAKIYTKFTSKPLCDPGAFLVLLVVKIVPAESADENLPVPAGCRRAQKTRNLEPEN